MRNRVPTTSTLFITAPQRISTLAIDPHPGATDAVAPGWGSIASVEMRCGAVIKSVEVVGTRLRINRIATPHGGVQGRHVNAFPFGLTRRMRSHQDGDRSQAW